MNVHVFEYYFNYFGIFCMINLQTTVLVFLPYALFNFMNVQNNYRLYDTIHPNDYSYIEDPHSVVVCQFICQSSLENTEISADFAAEGLISSWNNQRIISKCLQKTPGFR